MMEKNMFLSIISLLRRAASRRHSIEGARSSKCPFKLLLASLDRFPSADGMYFHLFPRLLTAVALPLSSLLRPRCTLARETRFAGALFETLVSPAGARFTDALFETLVPRPACPSHLRHTVLRRRQAPLSTHIEPSGCTAPICVRRPSSTSVPSLLSGPFRASRGRSPGATVAPPPGMGWTLGTGISPRGPPKVTRGEVPKVLDCRTTDSFWVPFWYPFFGPTCTQFYKKYQNGVPKSCQKGGGLLPQQSPNNPPQQSPPKPI